VGGFGARGAPSYPFGALLRNDYRGASDALRARRLAPPERGRTRTPGSPPPLRRRGPPRDVLPLSGGGAERSEAEGAPTRCPPPLRGRCRAQRGGGGPAEETARGLRGLGETRLRGSPGRGGTSACRWPDRSISPCTNQPTGWGPPTMCPSRCCIPGGCDHRRRRRRTPSSHRCRRRPTRRRSRPRPTRTRRW